VMRADAQTFQTGWFVESVLSAGAVVFAVRTRLPFLRSKPSRLMLTITAIVMLITLWLPYSPLARLLGFKPLSLPFLLVIFGIVALYFISAELTKHWFYRQSKNNG